MSDAVPSDRKQKGGALLDNLDKIAPVLLASGAKSEEFGTLPPDAATAPRRLGICNLKHCTEISGSATLRKPSLAEMCPRLPYPLSRPDGRPHVFGGLLRRLNIAGLRQVMSGTAYENHGKFLLGLRADPLS